MVCGIISESQQPEILKKHWLKQISINLNRIQLPEYFEYS